MKTTLIVGGDSLLGKALLSYVDDPQDLLITSRRIGVENRVYLNLDDPNFELDLSIAPKVAYFFAGCTNIEFCEEEFDKSRNINCCQTLKFISELVSRGAFVVWVSSSAVFSGDVPWPNEDSKPSPTTSYGKQKQETELSILNSPILSKNVAIVRLTKVISAKSGIVFKFISELKAGNKLSAFGDLKFTPISLVFVCRSLISIASKRSPGIFHLSGEKEFTYAEFATAINCIINESEDMVVPTSTSDVGIKVNYKPKHSGLGMSKTNLILGLEPESQNHLIAAVLKESNEYSN